MGDKVTYTPAADYYGPDSFTFTAGDGTATSGAATVSLTVSPSARTLTYSAGPGGTITGTSPQTVNHGADGTAVTACRHRLPLRELDRRVHDRYAHRHQRHGDITRHGHLRHQHLHADLHARPNGTITGTSPQTVNHGADGTRSRPSPTPATTS